MVDFQSFLCVDQRLPPLITIRSHQSTMKSHGEIPKNMVLSAENLHGEIRTKTPNKMYWFLHMLTIMLKQQKKTYLEVSGKKSRAPQGKPGRLWKNTQGVDLDDWG